MTSARVRSKKERREGRPELSPLRDNADVEELERIKALRC